MEKQTLFQSLAIAALFLLIPQFASSAQSPLSVVETSAREVLSLLSSFADNDTLTDDEKYQQLYHTIEPVFDFHMLSMGALGRLRRSFSESEQSEFTTWFSRLVSQTYFDKLDGKDIHSVTIQYEDTVSLNSRSPDIELADVPTQVSKDDLTIPIVYRMIKRDQQNWRVYDIKIEGVSLVANYREQYRSRISATPEELIEELKKKVSQ